MAPPTPARARTTLLGNLGSYSRAIRTTNAEAQQFFDEGLTLLYGFNHDESFRSFARAAALDDRAPMPHWGMALALGTNINDPAPADRLARAYTHLAAAQARAANGSPVEQALIAALSKRYVANPTGDQAPREQAYSDAMGEVAKTLSGRSGCGDAVCREPDEPAPLAALRCEGHTGARARTPSSPRSSA